MIWCNAHACIMGLKFVKTVALIYHFFTVDAIWFSFFFIFQSGVTTLMHQMVSHCPINLEKGPSIDFLSNIHQHICAPKGVKLARSGAQAYYFPTLCFNFDYWLTVGLWHFVIYSSYFCSCLNAVNLKASFLILVLSGPKNWGDICASGKKQSPIDILTKTTEYDTSLGGFTLLNYETTPSQNFTSINNKHTLQVSLPSDYYKVSGGNLPGTFTTVQFHLHWGSDNTKGAEHGVNGKFYPAEVSTKHSWRSLAQDKSVRYVQDCK